MLRFFIHYGFHFIFPFLIAYVFYRKKYFRTYLILISGILIDIDHLWASPVFDPDRCSVGFHFLHSYPLILLYVVLFAVKRTRIVGLALLLHILADAIDCLLMP
ncbi:hypothetical protein GWK08_01675 [Leptobacterium flavescens]|uniref:Metal-dependent hydrolase n=1 Tax=Leptobacterium flavescens TaxID=472055 RepID=A0A6P0UJS5_9FLAO|nr:DUF6122 family protein [Leptobacterium flavescens]NER12138.1 hypothetical protein [Leptobacterium flavescens]